MKRAGLGLLASWGGLFAADAAPGVLGGWADVTALAVLMWALWYLLAKYIPGRDKQFTDSLLAQQQTFAKTLDKIVERYDEHERSRQKDAKQLADALNELMVHCARVQAEDRARRDPSRYHIRGVADAREGSPPGPIDCEGT